ncbi:MAG: hypothetical protein ACRC80_08675, partial [Waterburya sp.]
NNSDRLDRIEAVVESLARSAQAIANDHEERIRLLEETQRDLAQTSAGLARLLIALDEDRPTILRRLMAIENKVDTLIERNQ